MDQLLAITHRLAWQLRPALLDNVGLDAALREHLRGWGHPEIESDYISRLPQSAASTTKTGKVETGLTSEAETALYRVVQESLTNVLRHARATLVSVILERGAKFVTVIIEDNGRGFAPEAAPLSTRLGLRGMQARMELVGGTLEIESAPGDGTTIYARVPLTSIVLSNAQKSKHQVKRNKGNKK